MGLRKTKNVVAALSEIFYFFHFKKVSEVTITILVLINFEWWVYGYLLYSLYSNRCFLEAIYKLNKK